MILLLSSPSQIKMFAECCDFIRHIYIGIHCPILTNFVYSHILFNENRPLCWAVRSWHQFYSHLSSRISHLRKLQRLSQNFICSRLLTKYFMGKQLQAFSHYSLHNDVKKSRFNSCSSDGFPKRHFKNSFNRLCILRCHDWSASSHISG